MTPEKRRLKGYDPTPRQYVQSLLPSDYEVSEMLTGIIRCTGTKGIEEDTTWDNFFKAIKEYFGQSFREIHHWVNYNHKNFTVYYRYDDLYNLNLDENGNYSTQNTVNQST